MIYLLSLAVALISQAPQAPAPQHLFNWKDARITENSGLAASRRYPGMLWTHNDSGDEARVFLVDQKGNTRATVVFEGAVADDWEDMAVVGSGQNGWLYVGDIGDNLEARPNIVIYRMREPKIDFRNSSDGVPPTLRLRYERMTLTYPDGARNAETLAVSPRGQLLIVTKGLEASGFYVVPSFHGGRQVLRKIGEYTFGPTSGPRRVRLRQTTGGDFSPDGKRLVVISYTQAYQWTLSSPQLKSIFDAPPRVMELPALNQAESVCYSMDGKNLFVSSEGEGAPLWKLPLP